MDDAYDPKLQPAVLFSFNIFDNKNPSKIPAKDIILYDYELNKQNNWNEIPDLEIKEYKCEIVVLGLRNLVSAGLLPINKAFVKFNIKSMMPSD